LEHPSKAKEDEIIVHIARQPDLTQRQLASETGISLGMTNIILKRLAHKGLVKMKRLNRRNIKYVLTPSGIAHYSRRSYDYLLRTVSSVKSIKQKIKGLVLEEVGKGAKGFSIRGEGELADIAELALRDLASELETEWARGDGKKGWV
jgi:DNA-binding MarR family transcriptional regulator